MKINYLDLFSGTGGFSEGLRQAGFEFNWHGFSEIDKHAKQIYQKHFPSAEDSGDVKAIKTDFGRQINLVTFGFPCTDLSISGKRKGLARSLLREEISGLKQDCIRLSIVSED